MKMLLLSRVDKTFFVNGKIHEIASILPKIADKNEDFTLLLRIFLEASACNFHSDRLTNN